MFPPSLVCLYGKGYSFTSSVSDLVSVVAVVRTLHTQAPVPLISFRTEGWTNRQVLKHHPAQLSPLPWEMGEKPF